MVLGQTMDRPRRESRRHSATARHSLRHSQSPHRPLRERSDTSQEEVQVVATLWEALDKLGFESWTLDSKINPARVFHNVLVNRYKDRICDGCVLFAAVEYCADILDDGLANGLRDKQRIPEDVPKIIKAVLDSRADLNAEATHSKGGMRVLHYAAGLGAVPVLEALLHAHVEAAGPEANLEQVKRQVLNVRTRWESFFYTPLHDAVWFRMTDAVQWLLRHGADVNAQNSFGRTPLHLVAKVGSELEVVEELVEVLMEHSADLAREDNEHLEPLMLAVSGPFFPISKFHLLAPSCRDPKSTFPMYLRDVTVLAMENEQAAEEFVKVLLGIHASERARNDADDDDDEDDEPRPLRFVQSVDTASARSGQERHQALLRMAEVMEKAPRSAAMILDVLVGSPVVQCPEFHPLPRRANLELDGCKETMLCDYQPDFCESEELAGHEMSWNSRVRNDRRAVSVQTRRTLDRVKAPAGSPALKALTQPLLQQDVKEVWRYRLPKWGFDTDNLRTPAWHEAFAPMPLNQNDDKEVDVLVLKMPDLLDVRVIRVLAKTRHLGLFAEKTVQGIANCLWHKLVKHGVKMAICMRVFTLATMLTWISLSELDPTDSVPIRRISWLIVLATATKDLFNLAYSVRLCSTLWTHKPMAHYLFSIEVMADLLDACLLFALAWSTRADFTFPDVGWGRSILALSTLMRWFQITYMCRAFKKVGKKIVCVLKSFLPMTEMMLITAVVFFGFGVAAVLIHDDCDEKCAAAVLMNLFKALLLGDGNSFDDLTQLSGQRVFAPVLLLVATVLFSISVLNLLIAVYSNEYDRNEKQADLLFFKERTSVCFQYLLEPLWSNWQNWPRWLWRWHDKRRSSEAFVRWLVGGTTSVFVALAVLLAEGLHLLFLPLALLVAAMLFLQMAAMRCDWDHPRRTEEGLHFYLWICCRADFDDLVESTLGDETNFDDVNTSIQKMSRSLDRQMRDMQRQISTLDRKVRPARPVVSPQPALRKVREVPRSSNSEVVRSAVVSSLELRQLQEKVSQKTHQQCKELLGLTRARAGPSFCDN